ncbi:MAG: hypothetical protein ACM3TU_01360 [Bacillota bacterium]
MHDTVSLAAGVVSAALVLVAFLVYNRDDSKINTGTWLILALGDSFDFWSYFQMTDENWLKNAVPIAFAGGSVITFGIALARRRFSWPDPHDWVIIGLDILITIWWRVSSDNAAANLLYQATAILAFLPMYRGLIEGKERETFLPWILWTAAFGTFFVTAVMHMTQWQELVYPIVGTLTHGLVIGFVLRARGVRRT